MLYAGLPRLPSDAGGPRRRGQFEPLRHVVVALAALIGAGGTAEAQNRALMAPGYAVVTGFSGTVTQPAPDGQDPLDFVTLDANGASARTVDLTVLGPQGQPSIVPKPFTATAAQVGQVFGVALDDASAPNIYLAATSAYGLSLAVTDPSGQVRRVRKGTAGASFVAGQFGPAAMAGGPTSIWRIDGASGAVSLFTNVDGGVWRGPAGLGNLTFDPASRRLYAADRGTGLIHALAIETGAPVGLYDHGGSGRVAAGLPPVALAAAAPVDITNPAFDTETPATWGFAPPERRVYGLAVHKQRLYYSVAAGPQVWSVGLAGDGGFTGDARVEVDVPGVAPEHEIASISFDGDGRMYLAERGATIGDYALTRLAEGGAARVLRFLPKPANDPAPGFWIPTPETYSIGLPPDHRNAEGGVALGYAYRDNGTIDTRTCGATLWSTGERLLSRPDTGDTTPPLDGLQGEAPSLVQPRNTPPVAAWFVDYDDKAGQVEGRGQVGAVAILAPCARQGAWYPLPVISCPADMIYRGGACVYPTCPPGLYRSGDRCLPPPRVCPPNTVFDGRVCVPVGCPAGLIPTRAGYCACPPGRTYYDGRCVPVCPPGYYRTDSGRCLPPACPPGFWRTPDGRCLPPACPPGYERDRRGVCLPPCPRGEDRDRFGRCEPPRCPPGQVRDNNGRCMPPACPPGEVRDQNGRCRPPQCPPGQVRDNNGRCMPPACPPGEIRDRNGRCVTPRLPPRPTVQCQPGQRLVGDRCVPIARPEIRPDRPTVRPLPPRPPEVRERAPRPQQQPLIQRVPPQRHVAPPQPQRQVAPQPQRLVAPPARQERCQPGQPNCRPPR